MVLKTVLMNSTPQKMLTHFHPKNADSFSPGILDGRIGEVLKIAASVELVR
jgi:hypothetical protein